MLVEDVLLVVVVVVVEQKQKKNPPTPLAGSASRSPLPPFTPALPSSSPPHACSEHEK